MFSLVRSTPAGVGQASHVLFCFISCFGSLFCLILIDIGRSYIGIVLDFLVLSVSSSSICSCLASNSVKVLPGRPGGVWFYSYSRGCLNIRCQSWTWGGGAWGFRWCCPGWHFLVSSLPWQCGALRSRRFRCLTDLRCCCHTIVPRQSLRLLNRTFCICCNYFYILPHILNILFSEMFMGEEIGFLGS